MFRRDDSTRATGDLAGVHDMTTCNSRPAEYESDLLLVLPVCFGQDHRGLLFESQACNGLECWLENFERIQVVCPVIAGDQLRAATSTVWKPVSEIANAGRVTFVPLPFVTSLAGYIRFAARGRSAIRQAIEQSRYLSFAGGQLFGDWGSGRLLWRPNVLTGRIPFGPMRVQHRLCLATVQAVIRCVDPAKVGWRLMYTTQWRCIEGCSLGLFHGASCYAAYSPWCATSYVVHDVHAKQSDSITDSQLDEKCREIASADHLEIIYAGRADTIKAPFIGLIDHPAAETVRAVSGDLVGRRAATGGYEA